MTQRMMKVLKVSQNLPPWIADITFIYSSICTMNNYLSICLTSLTQTLTNFFTEKRISRGNPKVKEEKEGEASDTTQPAKTPSQKKKKKGESKTGKRDKNDGERKGRTRKTNKNDGEREANASKGNRNEGERRRKRKQNSKGDGGQDLSLSQSTVEQKNVLREGERGNGNADDPAGNGGRGDQQPEEGDEGAAQPDEEPAPVGVQEEYIAVVLELETTDFGMHRANSRANSPSLAFTHRNRPITHFTEIR